MNIFNIERAFQKRKERGNEKTFWCIDLHDCIFVGNYQAGSSGGDFYPNAIRVLKQLTMRKDFVLILHTASNEDGLKEAIMRFKNNGIVMDYINCNPECESTEMCDFSEKFYADIILDDKAGFEGEKDWFLIEAELKRVKQWIEPRTPLTASDIVIEYKDKIVLVNRLYPPLGYALPGGFQDIGETTIETAYREAIEETGLKVKNLKLIGFKDTPGRDPRWHVNTFIYYGTGTGELNAGDDATECILVEPDDVLNGQVFMAFPGHVDSIKSYLDMKKRLTN